MTIEMMITCTSQKIDMYKGVFSLPTIANSKSNSHATLRGGTRLVYCGKPDIHPSLTIRKAVLCDYLSL